MNQNRLLARYRIETAYSLEHAAEVIAGEQSTGTFISVPGETASLKERFGAMVVSITETGEVMSPSLPGEKFLIIMMECTNRGKLFYPFQ